MRCPRCDGEVFDNRSKKESGEYKANAPDFKCRDQECKWAQWPDKKAGEAKPAAFGSPPSVTAPADNKRERFAALLDTYDICLDRAADAWCDRYDDTTPADVRAAAATVFMKACDLNLLVRRKKQEKLSEKPKAIKEHEEELADLPF